MQETFRPIPCVDTRYAASNLGYILNIDTGRHMKASPVRGFPSVRVRNANLEPFVLRVSRGVLLAFTPIVDAKQYTVRHKDEDLLNARLDNLFWEYRFGEKHGRSKLTERDVVEIRQLYCTTNLPLRAIGERFGVAYKTVQSILVGDSWAHII